MSRKISSMLGLAVAGSMLAMAASSAQAGPKAYVGNFTDNTVSVIDTSTGSAIATIPVAAGPHGMAISQDGSTVYVAGDGSSSLNVIDTATDRVTKTLDVGKKPNGITLTPDGKLLLVTLYGEDRIALLDTATNDVVGTIPVPKPHTVSVEPSGKLAYATSQEPGHFGLAVIDLGSRSVVRTVPLDKTPRDGEFGANGRRFYFTEAGVAAVQVLDPASDKVVAEIPTGISPHFVDLFDGTKLGVVVVQGPGQLMLFDPDTNKEVRSIAVGPPMLLTKARTTCQLSISRAARSRPSPSVRGRASWSCRVAPSAPPMSAEGPRCRLRTSRSTQAQSPYTQEKGSPGATMTGRRTRSCSTMVSAAQCRSLLGKASPAPLPRPGHTNIRAHSTPT